MVYRSSIPEESQAERSAVVAHLLWEQDVGGSTPLAPTTHKEKTNDSCAPAGDLYF